MDSVGKAGRMGGDSVGKMGPVGTKRKCTRREEDVMGRCKKGLGITMSGEGSDGGVNKRSLKFLVANVI